MKTEGFTLISTREYILSTKYRGFRELIRMPWLHESRGDAPSSRNMVLSPRAQAPSTRADR